MTRVSIVDYGLGNIKAFAHIYERLNIDVETVTTTEQLKAAERLILPGVGAFDWAMSKLNQSGLRNALEETVVGNKVPVLGVCVGMQMMSKSSDEGELPGLGWIDANVVRFDHSGNADKPLPHMGWNDAQPRSSECLFKGLVAPRFYYLHSYCIVPVDEVDVLATAGYGKTFASSVRRNNVYGTQFHPEKSHKWGMDLLRNFAEL